MLLIATAAQAQIDLNDVKLTSDSTFATKKDTAYWKFETATAVFTRPNGETRNVQVFEAKLIFWQGGKRTVPISSGVLFKKEYLAFLDQYRDQHNNEINIVVDALNGIRDRRDALVSEIQKTRQL